MHMLNKKMPKRAILRNVFFDQGLFTVEYFSDQDQSVTLTMAIPSDEEGNYINPQELIEVIKDRFPDHEFNLMAKQHDPKEREAYEELLDLEIVIEDNKNIMPESQDTSDEDIELYSRYNVEFEVDNIRHIVLETLINMGVIK